MVRYCKCVLGMVKHVLESTCADFQPNHVTMLTPIDTLPISLSDYCTFVKVGVARSELGSAGRNLT